MTNSEFWTAGLGDYIAPGEFEYDASGLLLEETEFDLPLSEDIQGALTPEARHNLLLAMREAVAVARKASGVKPKWWVGG